MSEGKPAAGPAETGPPPPTAEKFLLKLYVAGGDARAQTAVANLRRICDTELAGQYELEVIDVLEQPEQAERAKILATPTLIKQLPPPLRRVIGDLSNHEKLLLGLQIGPSPANRDRGARVP